MAEAQQQESAAQGPPSVAVIGDDAGLSYLLRRMFELNGLAVVAGYPGQFEGDTARALHFFDEREVRVVVWRLAPGDVSGWALAHLLRKQLAASGRRLLIVTDDPAALARQVGESVAAESIPLGRDVSSLARLAAAVERALAGGPSEASNAERSGA